MRAINMSSEPTPHTIALTGRSRVRATQPDWPLNGSAPASWPDGLDAGPDPAASNQEIRCVMSLLLT